MIISALRYARQTAAVIAICGSLGCSPTPDLHAESPHNADGTLKYAVRALPMVVEHGTFSGVWTPNFPSDAELAQLLERPIRRPATGTADESAIALIEKTSGRRIVWYREADSRSFRSVEHFEKWTFDDLFPSKPSVVTVGKAIENLLVGSMRELVNSPTDQTHLYRNFAVITDEFIIILALPVERFKNYQTQ